MPELILAIDPGTVQSGWLLWDAKKQQPVGFGKEENYAILDRIESAYGHGVMVAIERIRAYGMAVGNEVLETAEWTGRFVQKCEEEVLLCHLVPRKEVVLHLCGSARAKDTNIRQVLIDRFGPQGTKKAKGRLYGISGHAWAALAIAVYAQDQLAEGKEQPCPQPCPQS